MKKTFIFVMFLMLVSGFCFAQSVNNEQRIIGTWVVNSEASAGSHPLSGTLVFNTNGTVSLKWPLRNYLPVEDICKYFITSSSLILIATDASSPQGRSEKRTYCLVYKYSMSSDGKILFLESGNGHNLLIKQ